RGEWNDHERKVYRGLRRLVPLLGDFEQQRLPFADHRAREWIAHSVHHREPVANAVGIEQRREYAASSNTAEAHRTSKAIARRKILECGQRRVHRERRETDEEATVQVGP